MYISRFGRLYVGDFLKNGFTTSKIVFHPSENLVVDYAVLCPYVTDVESNSPILISNDNHVKPLAHYMNQFGWKRKVPAYEKEKQRYIVKEVKELYKLKKI